MRKSIVAFFLLLLLLAAPAAWGADSILRVEGITSNSSSAFTQLSPGIYVVIIYAPDAGAASDPCGTGGGNFDTSSVTIEHTPDLGVTTLDADVAELVGATALVQTTMTIGKGIKFRVTVASVGASTCINVLFARSQD